MSPLPGSITGKVDQRTGNPGDERPDVADHNGMSSIKCSPLQSGLLSRPDVVQEASSPAMKNCRTTNSLCGSSLQKCSQQDRLGGSQPDTIAEP